MEENRQITTDRTILKYTGIFGGLQGLTILIGIIRNKLVALILGPQGVGLISLFNSTINFMLNKFVQTMDIIGSHRRNCSLFRPKPYS